MSNKYLMENRQCFVERAAFMAKMVPGFEAIGHEDTQELKVDLPTNTFNQLILGPKTMEGGADAILNLLPKERQYSLWSWQKRINGIGPVTEMAAMVCEPDPWMPDPDPGEGRLILATSPEHFKVAGEVIARTMQPNEATVIRRVFSIMQILEPKERSRMKRLLYTVGNKAVATICLYQNEDRGLIFDFATQPQEQGKGYGSTLLAIAIREFMNSGCWRIHLQSVSTATELYRRHKFRTIGKVYEAHGNRNQQPVELPPLETDPNTQKKKSPPAIVTGVTPGGPGDQSANSGDAAPIRRT